MNIYISPGIHLTFDKWLFLLLCNRVNFSIKISPLDWLEWKTWTHKFHFFTVSSNNKFSFSILIVFSIMFTQVPRYADIPLNMFEVTRARCSDRFGWASNPYALNSNCYQFSINILKTSENTVLIKNKINDDFYKVLRRD